MGGVLTAFVVSFGVVFVAELGDKSQLLTLAFSTRYRWPVVLAGITIASFVMHGLAVAVGSALGAVIPERLVQLAAGVAFLVFGLLALRSDDDEEDEEAIAARAGNQRSAVLAVTGAFVVAELGDKTQLASLALAGTRNPFGVWLGASIGMVLANLLGIAAGVLLGRHLPERAIRLGAAALFVVFGVLLLADAAMG